MKTASLMPLNALVLGACGAGGTDKSGTEDATGSTLIRGNVIKGPITNAIVFSDLDGDATLDNSEPYTYTDENGNFVLSVKDSLAKLIALGQPSSLDKSSGASASHIYLSGTTAGTVISPFSTLIADTALSASELAKSVGVPNLDLLNFNPYGASTAEVQSVFVETTSHQLANVIFGLAEATKVSGLSSAQSKQVVIDSVATLLKKKIDTGQTVDLSNDEDLQSISQNILDSTELSTANKAKLGSTLDTALQAVKNVNAVVKDVSDLNSEAAKSVFSLNEVLVSQIADNVSKNSDVKLTDASYVTELIQGSPQVSVGALDVINIGSSGAPVLDFYLDETKDLDGDGINSIELDLSFDPNKASYVSLTGAEGFLSAVNDIDASNGNIIFGGISLSGVSVEQPLFTMHLLDLDVNTDIVLSVSNLIVENTVMDGSTLII